MAEAQKGVYSIQSLCSDTAEKCRVGQGICCQMVTQRVQCWRSAIRKTERRGKRGTFHGKNVSARNYFDTTNGCSFLVGETMNELFFCVSWGYFFVLFCFA